MRIIEPPLGLGSAKSAADLFECGRQIGDQPKKRLLDVRLITLLVRLEPSALVVRLEILEKAEETWPEITVRCHGLLRHLRPHLYVRSRYLCKALAVSRRFFLPIMPMRGMKILNTPFGIISSSWSIRVLAPSAVKMNLWPPASIFMLGTIRTCLFGLNSLSSCSTLPKPLISSSN